MQQAYNIILVGKSKQQTSYSRGEEDIWQGFSLCSAKMALCNAGDIRKCLGNEIVFSNPGC